MSFIPYDGKQTSKHVVTFLTGMCTRARQGEGNSGDCTCGVFHQPGCPNGWDMRLAPARVPPKVLQCPACAGLTIATDLRETGRCWRCR